MIGQIYITKILYHLFPNMSIINTKVLHNITKKYPQNVFKHFCGFSSILNYLFQLTSEPSLNLKIISLLAFTVMTSTKL